MVNTTTNADIHYGIFINANEITAEFSSITRYYSISFLNSQPVNLQTA